MEFSKNNTNTQKKRIPRVLVPESATGPATQYTEVVKFYVYNGLQKLPDQTKINKNEFNGI